ncbi:hypothetical protein MK489_03820 [Myxococcota bacterium]|nr:hypothetical protein [Myxococcota bacterium]
MSITNLERTPSSGFSETVSTRRAALDRLDLRIDRLGLTFRLTYAFHARELRFERDSGDGFSRIFPETFSFRADQHDPAELYLQLEDLARKPSLLATTANRRDVQVLISRLTLAIPSYLEALVTRLETEAMLDGARLESVFEDLAVLSSVLLRFLRSRGEESGPGTRMAIAHLRKLLLHGLSKLMHRRVPASYLEAYMEGRIDPVDPADDLSESGFSLTLASGEADAVNRCLVRLAERAFYDWVEEICLDATNGFFEIEGSPFGDRETELRHAIASEERVERGRDLSPFLRRRGNRDVLRVLGKLEAWFLGQYDVHHAAVMIHHAEYLRSGVADDDLVLSRHYTRNYVLAIAGLMSPFLAAALAYDRAPRLFDLLCSAEMLVVDLGVVWFLLYRFCWKKDLSFFHASVPRIGAGIIVGYLPIFFIDEVWYLAQQSAVTIVIVCLVLGFANLLYLYVEVQSRLRNSVLAFARARQIFMLGILQALGMGLVLTGMIGGFMAARNWQSDGESLPLVALRESLPSFVGQLPMIPGVEPFFAYPSAVLLMTFLSFFIGTFLQLMWEDLPITEPL